MHFKYVRDMQHLNPYIALKSRQLVTAIDEVTIQLIVKAGADPGNIYPSEAELKKIGSKIHFSDPAPEEYRMVHPHIKTMSDFMYHWKDASESQLEDILKLSQYLESAHIKLLLKIQESSFYRALATFKRVNLDNDVSVFSRDLYALSQHAKTLKQYCDVNLSSATNFNDKNS